MSFGKSLRQYRENMNITQLEAAYQLDLVPNTYSNYERCKRPIPIELLPKIKKAFNIPDEQFLDMLLNQSHRRKKMTVEKLAIQTKELRERYMISFGESYFDLISNTQELRQLLGFLNNLDDKKRRLCLNAIKSILVIYSDLADELVTE
ncbi:helix-turn-helix domain-containing protein [Ureibacillus endophyticus]|uniref:XRE family transcriptional regulator n=1 Tax=Ureibacillus endophyticus TaxID=1978490 RepID=A0A494Z5A9_9BACL|nr:helix-turn-helix transcriptional regulator [Lysinibacillus endophyticus]RKQ17746.1 XRE family transcriptional regulator [Lysinibacillus endophyticus]